MSIWSSGPSRRANSRGKDADSCAGCSPAWPLRTLIGSHRRSVPFSSSRSKAYRKARGSVRLLRSSWKEVTPYSSQHTTSPSIRQERTFRWSTASGTAQALLPPITVEVPSPWRVLAASLLGIGRLPSLFRDAIGPAMNIRRRRARGPVSPLLRRGRIVQKLQQVVERCEFLTPQFWGATCFSRRRLPGALGVTTASGHGQPPFLGEKFSPQKPHWLRNFLQR